MDKEERQESVKHYLNNVLTSRLIFWDADEKEAVVFPKTVSSTKLDELVYFVIKNMETFSSKSGRTIETLPGRRRSVIDIWRHVINFKKDVTIFEVMESIYKLRLKLVGHYCNMTRRSVFFARDSLNGDSSEHTPFDDDDYFEDFECKEFGFDFSDWRRMVKIRDRRSI